MLTKNITNFLYNEIYDKITIIINRYIENGVNIYDLKQYYKVNRNLNNIISEIQHNGESLFNDIKEYNQFVKSVIYDILNDKISELETNKINEKLIINYKDFIKSL